MTGDAIEIGPENLSLRELESGAFGATVRLADTVKDQIAEGHRRLIRCLDEGQLIYGVTTGYGPLADTLIGRNYSAELQNNLIAHLSSGVGGALSRIHTRAIMLARLSALGKGKSGISPGAVDVLLRCLNRDAIPVVPSMGTVGASGDLTPLAHIAGSLMGQGEMRLAGDSPRPAVEVLREIGVPPFVPGGKDALALVNGTSAMTGISAINGTAAWRTLRWSALLSAGHAAVLEARREAWDAAFGELRPHPGQRQLHRWLNRLLPAEAPTMAKSAGVDPETIRYLEAPVQDAYSLRCAPQLLGAVCDQLKWHDQIVETELNSVTDNPVLPDDQDLVLHGGNFYGQHVAFAADALANAVITMAVHAERRIARICHPRLNRGLPAFLQAEKIGLQSGFMGAQVTASALLAEMRTKAIPASIQSVPTNGDNQDVVPMGTIGARRCAELLDLLNLLLAIDALVVAQAVDLRIDSFSELSIGEAILTLRNWVREETPRLTADRSLSKEIHRIAEKMASPSTLTDRMPHFNDRSNGAGSSRER